MLFGRSQAADVLFFERLRGRRRSGVFGLFAVSGRIRLSEMSTGRAPVEFVSII
jgi:hypothetical protein